MPRLAIPLLLLLSACPPRAQAPADASAAGEDAGQADGGWRLTPARLDAWLRYQSALNAQAPERRDGGALREEVRRRALLERGLRATHGLTQEDLDRLEELVGAVVARRALARISGVEAVRELERAAAGLKDAPRAQAEQALAELKERASQAERFSAERARFGDASVDVVLGRLADVEQTWDAMLR